MRGKGGKATCDGSKVFLKKHKARCERRKAKKNPLCAAGYRKYYGWAD